IRGKQPFRRQLSATRGRQRRGSGRMSDSCGTRFLLAAGAMEEDGKDADNDQGPRYRPVEAIDGENRGRHEDKVKFLAKSLLTQVYDGGKDQTDSSSCDAFQSGSRPIVISVETVKDSNGKHHYRSR